MVDWHSPAEIAYDASRVISPSNVNTRRSSQPMQRFSLISSTSSLAFTCKHLSDARQTCRAYPPPQLGILRFS